MSGSTGAIPASFFATVNPGVISAGGSNYALNGLVLTANTRVPVGTVQTFSSAVAVGAYFGLSAQEYTLAVEYFGGFVNSSLKPGALLFSQYAWAAPVSAYLRGANVSGLTLGQLRAVGGNLIVTIDGIVQSATGITLTAATSFSSAATIIGTALGLPSQVTYDSVSGAFVISSATTGVSSSLSFASGSVANELYLTQNTGAVLSQGAALSTPATAMPAVVSLTNNWFSFMTTFEPNAADKASFAAWVSGQAQFFLYAMWDSGVTATQSGATGLPYQTIVAAGYRGTSAIYMDPNVAAYLMGAIASVNYGQLYGVATMAFKSPSAGISPTVTNLQVATNLLSYGYNFYGIVGQQGNSWQFSYPGSVSGQYAFIDAYANAAWLSNQITVSLMNLLTAVRTVPYNAAGYAQIQAACSVAIYAAVTAGVISSGVTLSLLQASEVNAAAGLSIDTVLSTVGWYFQVVPATAAQRAARTSPSISLWYMYAGSVQQITLGSVLVQ